MKNKYSWIYLASLVTFISLKNSFSIECLSYLSKVTTISEDQINDNYCDCPLTGEDEPNTPACSGSLEWPGVVSNDEEKEDHAVVVFYQCPDQPNLQIPPSRINDNVCDCCKNNSDESIIPTRCNDICEEVLAEERKARKELEEMFKVGYKKNLASRAAFVEYKQKTLVEIEEVNKNIEEDNTSVRAWEENFQREIRWWVSSRRNLLDQTFAPNPNDNNKISSFSWILGLWPEEAKSIILGLCQISGEWWFKHSRTVAVDGESKTCVPLHLAAFDLGYMWENEDQFDAWKATDGDVSLDLLMEMELNFISPAASANASANKKKSTHNSRREKDHYDDDGYYDDYEDYMDEEDIDYDHEHEEVAQPAQNNDENEKNDKKEKPNLVVPRDTFMKESDAILKMIQAVFDSSEEEDEEEFSEELDENGDIIENPEGEGQEQTQEKESKKPKIQIPENVDTLALQKTKGDIQSLKKHITSGKQFLQSGQALLNSFMNSSQYEKTPMLFPLLILSLLHQSKITSYDLYQVIRHSLSELNNSPSPEDDESCAPSFVTRNLKFGDGNEVVVQIPPPEIVQAAQQKCEERKKLKIDCSEQSITIENVVIPYHIEDGCIANTFPTEFRHIDPNKTPATYSSFVSFTDMNAQLNFPRMGNIDDVKKHRESLEKEKERKEKSISVDKFGPNGELFVFHRDFAKANNNDEEYGSDDDDEHEECISKPANQYVYEICVLKNIYQKEGDRGRGTNLGKFEKFAYDRMEITYTNGLRCWQGMNRKSLVKLTCGSELGEILSADEPEICSYEFIFRTFAACDERFAKVYGLEISADNNMVCKNGSEDCNAVAAEQ